VREGIVMRTLTIMADVLWLHHRQYVSYLDVSISVCDVSIRAKQEEEILSLEAIE
jgi:hypothetical protein